MRCSGYVLSGNPGADPGYAKEITFLVWLQATLESFLEKQAEKAREREAST